MHLLMRCCRLVFVIALWYANEVKLMFLQTESLIFYRAPREIVASGLWVLYCSPEREERRTVRLGVNLCGISALIRLFHQRGSSS